MDKEVDFSIVILAGDKALGQWTINKCIYISGVPIYVTILTLSLGQNFLKILIISRYLKKFYS